MWRQMLTSGTLFQTIVISQEVGEKGIKKEVYTCPTPLPFHNRAQHLLAWSQPWRADWWWEKSVKNPCSETETNALNTGNTCWEWWGPATAIKTSSRPRLGVPGAFPSLFGPSEHSSLSFQTLWGWCQTAAYQSYWHHLLPWTREPSQLKGRELWPVFVFKVHFLMKNGLTDEKHLPAAYDKYSECFKKNQTETGRIQKSNGED